MRNRYVQPRVILRRIVFALLIGILLMESVKTVGDFNSSIWWTSQWSWMGIVAAAVGGIIGGVAMYAFDRWLVRNRFETWHREWAEATKFSSSVHDIVSHPAYCAIIKMGHRVLTFIFEELNKECEHWFIALERITGVNPAINAPAGDLEAMRRAWLAWGRDNGYLK